MQNEPPPPDPQRKRPPIGFAAHVGREITELGHGTCTVSVTRRPELLQRLGYLHGGVIAFLVDSSAGIAAGTLLDPSQAVVTSEFKINFLAPARGAKTFSRARVIKPGRRTLVVAADVYSLENDQEIHAATALVTIAIVAPPTHRKTPLPQLAGEGGAQRS